MKTFKQKIDDPDESKYIISELDILRQEQAKHIPKIKDIFFSFCFNHSNVYVANIYFILFISIYSKPLG